MSGDYSRIRFNPRIDIAGVLMQQGRVQLDSDWNEWVAALDRRLRAESVDTVGMRSVPGIAGVAVVSPQTPDAFKLEITEGKLTIGRGRMYVDGLLAENHGDDRMAEFDPVLAELQGQITLAYEHQPYYPSPSALPRDGKHLAYLEVWQREITYLQRPELVESAVGVDTTTRLQTAWQVRFLNTGDANCSTPDSEVPEWKALISPSGGRISIKAEGVANDPHPCDPPPASGYSGLENQLYRIEIHDGGAAGTAKFKWSRDNASVATNVVEIVTSTELKLASLGRDAMMRFNTGDWVEITDDRRELSGERNDPALRRGEMRKIIVEDDQQSIRFTPALPPDLIPSGSVDDTLVIRHTRVRRWDQKGMVLDTDKKEFINLDSTNSGLIPVPPRGVGIILENGIQVQFDLDSPDGKFRCGDYWVSAARTADNSVEVLTKAPPRGIHRHYARLGIFNASDLRALQDCRTLWSQPVNDCCVELVARPGVGWEKIFDKVSKGSNSVICFPPGDYPINKTITVADKGHLLLYGSGRATRLMGNGSIESVVMFESCKGIDIRDLYVYGGSSHPHKNKITKGLLGTLTLRDIQKIALTRITTRCKPGREKGMACVRVENKVDKDGNVKVKGNVKVQECDFYIGHRQIGLLITNAESIRIHSNHFMASGRDVKTRKRHLQDSDVQVLSVAAQAIVIGGTRADHVLIESNEIDRVVQGIHVGLSHSTRIRTVENSDFLGRVILRQNKVNCLFRPDISPECHGLFVGNVRSLTIKDNYLTQAAELIGEERCDGIRVIGFLGEMRLIRGNHISGFKTAIRSSELSWHEIPNKVRVTAENYES